MSDIKVKVSLNIQQAMAYCVLGNKCAYYDWPNDQYMIYDKGVYIIVSGDGEYVGIPEHGALDIFAEKYTPEYIGSAWEII